MAMGSPNPRSADAARARLLGDQALRPIADRRAALEILARRLDRAGRGALMQSLAARLRTDRRFAPVFGALIHMALGGDGTGERTADPIYRTVERPGR